MEDKNNPYDFFKPKEVTEKGGAGSGNWGHTGLAGLWGGSDPGGGKGSMPTGGGSGGESAPADGGGGATRNTHRLDGRTFNKMMASNGDSELRELGKIWSKKYSLQELRGLQDDIRKEISRTAKSEDKKLEPSIYMQSLMNMEDALRYAVNNL